MGHATANAVKHKGQVPTMYNPCKSLRIGTCCAQTRQASHIDMFQTCITGIIWKAKACKLEPAHANGSQVVITLTERLRAELGVPALQLQCQQLEAKISKLDAGWALSNASSCSSISWAMACKIPRKQESLFLEFGNQGRPQCLPHLVAILFAPDLRVVYVTLFQP